MRKYVLLLTSILSTPAVAGDVRDGVTFAEETATAGIAHTFAGEWEYMVGGGAAAFDCDADGFDDIFIAGGVNKSALYRNASKQGGALAFVKTESGAEFDAVTGTYPLDIDSDGVTDLVILRVGENIVMRGLGGCKFERANEAWGFDGGDGWSTAFAATWEKGAAWPTIAIGNYIDRREEISPWGSCTDNWLHRPHANGKGFAKPLALKPSFCPLSMIFSDWNRSGTPGLRVSNDREYYEGGQEQLWKIEPGRPPELYTPKEGWGYVRIWGMGIASTDLNGDSYPDYYLTSMADSRLQTLAKTDGGNPKPIFKEEAFPRGITAHRPYTGDDKRPSTGWHAQFEDVNNDSRPDLFVAKGNVWEMPDFAMRDPNNLFLQGEEGKFVEAGDRAGVASMATSRGAVMTDFNLDGLVDIAVVNRNSPMQIWRNTSTSTGHWLGVRLRQDGPNRDGIGAWLEVRRGETITRRELFSGGGHVSGQLSWWHMGLGDATQAEVRVLWPDGEQGPWQAVTADGLYVLERGKPPSVWTPEG